MQRAGQSKAVKLWSKGLFFNLTKYLIYFNHIICLMGYKWTLPNKKTVATACSWNWNRWLSSPMARNLRKCATRAKVHRNIYYSECEVSRKVQELFIDAFLISLLWSFASLPKYLKPLRLVFSLYDAKDLRKLKKINLI